MVYAAPYASFCIRKATARHGLRRSLPTLIRKISVVLHHAKYLDGRREMLQWYADYIDNLERDGNVVHGEFGCRA